MILSWSNEIYFEKDFPESDHISIVKLVLFVPKDAILLVIYGLYSG